MGRDALSAEDKAERQKLAEFGWRNWYINRGRFANSWGHKGGAALTMSRRGYDGPAQDERMVSWRRAL